MESSLIINNKSFKIDNIVETKKAKLALKNSSFNKKEGFFDFDKLDIKDNYKYKNDYIIVKRQILIKESDYYSIEFKINHNINDYEIFIPSLIYKNNVQGKGHFPRVNDEYKYWSFDESRMSLPACIEIFNTNGCFIVSSKANKIHLAASWDQNSIMFKLPSNEYPYQYLGKDGLTQSKIEKDDEFILLEKGQLIEQTFYLYSSSSPNLDEYDYYYDYIKLFLNREPVNRDISLYDYKALLLRHLLFLVEKKDGDCYLKMGKGNEPYQPIYNFTSASFLVKSIEGAYIFKGLDVKKIKKNASLQFKEILEEEEKKILKRWKYDKLAYKIADYFLQAEENDGIFRDCQSLENDIWGGYLGIGENNQFRYYVNSRTNGEALLAYLDLANISNNKHKKKYLNLIENICSFYLSHQLEDGNYGRWWDKDGTVLDKKGTNGAYIFLFMIKYYQQTNRDDIYQSIKKAATYYSKLIEDNNFYGDTLDADSCDKEAGQILLKAFLALYEVEGFHTEYILNLCKKSANFIITWIQMDNIYFAKNTPLGKRNFKTLGLTSVSIANQHLDFYGMMIAYDFLTLNKHCNDETYFILAKYMINACFNLISKPDDLLDRDKEYLGWLPEQINHTKWDYFNNNDNISGHFAINIAWVQVLVLDYIDKIEKEFFEALN